MRAKSRSEAAVANSSDWITALAAAPPPDAGGETRPAWLAQLETDQPFCTLSAFAQPPTLGAPNIVPAQSGEGDRDGDDKPAMADALARAFAEGEAAGRAAAEADEAARSTRQRALRLRFAALDEAALAVLADDLAATVVALCDAALGEHAIAPAALTARCHAAAQRIGGAAGALALHLHPDDLALLDDGAIPGWQVRVDPALERGSVVVEGPDGVVSDGPADWRRAIAAAVRG